MRDDDKIRLKANHKFLVTNLSVDGIQDYLYQKGVLTCEELEDVLAERTTTRQSRHLLMLLPKKGDNAYDIFIESLRDLETADYIVDKLCATRVEEFRESDYVDALHEEDKLKHLQQQMYQQTQLLTQAKKEIDALKSRIQDNEKESTDLKTKYSELEETMAQKGLTQGHVVNILTDYLSTSTDIPDMGNARFVSPVPSPSRPVKSTVPVFSFSESDIAQNKPQGSTVVIAREMGRDIVKYVVQKTLMKPVSKPSSNYSATMRRLVDELFAKWEGLFDKFISKLHMDEISGYETFISVADEIFREGEKNWGRIVVLYAFAGYVARHCVENEVENIVEFMGDFLGFYVVKTLGSWITENGGWVRAFINNNLL